MPPKKPTPVKKLRDGVYYIKVPQTLPGENGAVLQLENGLFYEGIEMTYGQGKPYNQIGCLNQLWLVKRLKDEEAYTIVNIQAGTHMRAVQLAHNVSTITNVKGYAGENDRKWIIRKPKDSTLYKIQSKSTKKFVDIVMNEPDKTTASMKLRAGGWNEKIRYQLWAFYRVSLDYNEVKKIVQKNPYLQKNHHSYLLDAVYIIMDREWVTTIWRSRIQRANLRWREEIFDCDDFAITFKAHVSTWGSDMIKADGVALFFGIMLGNDNSKTPPPAHAYNFTLNAKHTEVEFFEPQDGSYSRTALYHAYVSIY